MLSLMPLKTYRSSQRSRPPINKIKRCLVRGRLGKMFEKKDAQRSKLSRSPPNSRIEARNLLAPVRELLDRTGGFR
jgi:hypothetical protein